jgi:hypothetical protein
MLTGAIDTHRIGAAGARQAGRVAPEAMMPMRCRKQMVRVTNDVMPHGCVGGARGKQSG